MCVCVTQTLALCVMSTLTSKRVYAAPALTGLPGMLSVHLWNARNVAAGFPPVSVAQPICRSATSGVS